MDPIDIGSRRQLFLDDYVIETWQGITRRVHRARKHEANPVVFPDQTWENLVNHPVAVQYNPDQKRYEMWYHSARIPWTLLEIAVAYSADGLCWEKPQLPDKPNICGLYPYDQLDESAMRKWGFPPSVTAANVKKFFATEPSNLVLVFMELQGIVRIPDAPDPNKRYVSSYCGGNLLFSSDGVHWTKGGCYFPGQNNTFNYDRDRKLFFGMFLCPPTTVGPDGTIRRALGLSTSEDLIHWTGANTDDIREVLDLTPDEVIDAYRSGKIRGEPFTCVETVMTADEHDDELATQWLTDHKDDLGLIEPIQGQGEFNGFSVMPYEGVYIGFPIALFANKAGTQFPAEAIRPCMPQLAFSRDLRHWKRFRQQIIPYGPAGSWDATEYITANQPLIMGDEVWLYYGAYSFARNGDLWANFGLNGDCDHQHGWLGYEESFRLRVSDTYHEPPRVTQRVQRIREGIDPPTSGIGIAKWRLDGFVSLDPTDATGTVTTKPLLFAGRHLEINANAWRGHVAVEIQDSAGRPLQGFTIDDCDRLTKDAVHHVVSWGGQDDVSRFQGRDVRLKFVIDRSSLFAFAFISEQQRDALYSNRDLNEIRFR